MGETIDLTFLSGSLQGLERELRLLRAQHDQFAGTASARLNGIDARLGGVDARLSVMEQSVHDMGAEVSRVISQLQQQLIRHEKRFDILDSGLASLRQGLVDSTEEIKRAILGAAEKS